MSQVMKSHIPTGDDVTRILVMTSLEPTSDDVISSEPTRYDVTGYDVTKNKMAAIMLTLLEPVDSSS